MGDDAFLKRMYAEAKELTDKVDKLTEFLKHDIKRTGISAAENVRLTNQLRAMNMYLDILNERIRAHS